MSLRMTTVTVRYFAGAAEAAGVQSEVLTASSVGELRRAMTGRHAALEGVLPRCSLLVAGVRAEGDEHLPDGVGVDVLPPFAGG